MNTQTIIHPWPIGPATVALPAEVKEFNSTVPFSHIYVVESPREFNLYIGPGKGLFIANIKPGDNVGFATQDVLSTLTFEYLTCNTKDALNYPNTVVIVSQTPIFHERTVGFPRLGTYETRTGLTTQPFQGAYDDDIPVVLVVPAITNYNLDNERTILPWVSVNSAGLTNGNIPAIGITNNPNVIASQGAAAAVSGAWPILVTNGVNTAVVKNTAVGAGDMALVVALSSNSSTIQVLASQSTPAAVGNAWPVKITDTVDTADVINPSIETVNTSNKGIVVVQSVAGQLTFQAVFRLAARPYPLANVFAAAGRKQYATIHHTAGAAKILVIRHAWVAVQSVSAACIVIAELVQINTAPATGNPAITASRFSTTAPEATTLALPTTAGTETGGIYGMQEWDLAATGAAPATNPTSGLNWYDLMYFFVRQVNAESSPNIPAATLGGFAVTLDVNAAATVDAYVIIEWSELT